jgi:hypothetical protein
MAELWFNTFFEVNLEYDVQQTLMRHWLIHLKKLGSYQQKKDINAIA